MSLDYGQDELKVNDGAIEQVQFIARYQICETHGRGRNSCARLLYVTLSRGLIFLERRVKVGISIEAFHD